MRNLLAIAPGRAASRSASSKTINGALPPNSSASFFTVPEHCFISSFPTPVEPVKLNLRTIGFPVNSLPIPIASPVTVLRIPAGTPALSASSQSANAEKGVSGAGLMTIGQPAAKAGAAFRVIMAAGKFHGVMATVTPIGCLITTIRLSVPCDGIVSPYKRLPSSPNHSIKPAA